MASKHLRKWGTVKVERYIFKLVVANQAKQKQKQKQTNKKHVNARTEARAVSMERKGQNQSGFRGTIHRCWL